MSAEKADSATDVRAVSEAIRFAEEYGYREWSGAQDALGRILRDRDNGWWNYDACSDVAVGYRQVLERIESDDHYHHHEGFDMEAHRLNVHDDCYGCWAFDVLRPIMTENGRKTPGGDAEDISPR